MSVVSNPLLQIASTASTQASTLANLSKAAEPAKDTSADFAKVYAKQSQTASTKVASTGQQQAANKQDQVASQTKSKTASDKDTAASKPAVADSGKNLPAQKTARVDKADKGDKADKSAKADKADKSKDDDQDDADTVTDASTTDATTPAVAVTTPDPTAPVAPTPDPTQAQAQQPTPTPDPAQTAALAQAAAPVQDTTSDSSTDTFDPSKDDPLANMPTLRLALEQSAKAQGTTSAHAQTSDAANDQTSSVNSDADQSFASGLAAMVVQQKGGGDSQTSDKAFDSQIDDGLKNVKGATADTRIDDFANRLAAMTDAPTAKTAAASTTTVQAPTTQLALNQNGWTEGVVNRVMYLSSQNLKSADIQLTPAELGRLSIRVDMAPDQQTQVTFTSAHLHVREALESQQGKLKDMFAEQGMGQLDVNVSDQSRQSSQDQAQQSQRTARGTGGTDSLDGVEATSPLASQPTVQQVVVGTSAIDYYA